MTFEQLLNDVTFFKMLSNGNFVLVLGAGFSYGIKNRSKTFESIPIASQFVELTNRTFLTETSEYQAAASVWEDRITSNPSLFDEFVKLFLVDDHAFDYDLYSAILLPRWHNIFTFNFDNVLERLLEKTPNASYRIRRYPVDTVDDDPPNILHLHGLLRDSGSRIDDIVFTSKSYADLQRERHDLYDVLHGNVRTRKKHLVIIGTQFNEQIIFDKFFGGLSTAGLSIYHFDLENRNVVEKPEFRNSNYHFVKLVDSAGNRGMRVLLQFLKSNQERIQSDTVSLPYDFSIPDSAKIHNGTTKKTRLLRSIMISTFITTLLVLLVVMSLEMNPVRESPISPSSETNSGESGPVRLTVVRRSARIPREESSIFSLDIDPKKRLLAIGASNGIRVYNLIDHSITHLPSQRATTIRAARFSPVRDWLAYGTDQGEISVFGLDTGRERYRTPAFSGPVFELYFSADGNEVSATGLEKPSSKLFRAFSIDSRLIKIGEFSVTRTNNRILAVSPDLRSLAVQNVATNQIQVWAVSRKEVTSYFDGAGVNAAGGGAFTGDLFCIGNDFGQVLFWRFGSPHLLQTLGVFERAVTSMSSSKLNGKPVLAVGSEDGRLAIIDATNREIRYIEREFESDVLALQFSFDGTLLAAGDKRGYVALLELR